MPRMRRGLAGEGLFAGTGRSMAAPLLAEMGARFGHDFSAVRIHDDTGAAALAETLGARAFCVGNDVAFAAGKFAPGSDVGRRLLAHELAHVVQNSQAPANGNTSRTAPLDSPAEASALRAAAGALSGASPQAVKAAATRHGPGGALQGDVNDPARYQQVHEALFSASSGGLKPWTEPAGKEEGTGNLLFRQAKEKGLKEKASKHLPEEAEIGDNTTEDELDTAAVTAANRLRKCYPQISSGAGPAEIKAAVQVPTLAQMSDTKYLHQFLTNKMVGWSDFPQYEIKEEDPRFVAVLDRLLGDKELGPYIKRAAQLVAGFQEGDGAARKISIHRGNAANAKRNATLIHELTHFFSDDAYHAWVEASDNKRLYNEGLTEFLAQRAMNDEEKDARSSYADRVEAVETKIAANIPEDDIARAFFAGEVWRMETRSEVAKESFSAATGLSDEQSPREEAATSKVAPGINEIVSPGHHYRFLNLGNDVPEPKPEHRTFFRQIKTAVLDPAPTQNLRFVGHASSSGSAQHNLELSRQRSAAFYRMARDEGVAPDHLPEAAKPPHAGESSPTAKEEDAQTRAFNRRVELFIDATGKMDKP